MSQSESKVGEQEEKTPDAAPVFKKPAKQRNVRRRAIAEEGDAEDQEISAVIIKKSRAGFKTDGKLGFSTATSAVGNSDKRVIVSGSSRDDGESTDAAPRNSQRPTFTFESSRQVQTQNDSRATATLETETEFDRDARAIREKVLTRAAEALGMAGPKGGPSSDGRVSGEEGTVAQDDGTAEGGIVSLGGPQTYKGMAGYMDHRAGFRRELSVATEKGSGSHGPLRASAHIRWSVRFDYQPDICKDYKETGYCGYGDACKFMHDRGDYKAGWQLDREWDEKEKRRKDAVARGFTEEGEEEEGDEEEDELPFACFICREPFVDPVVTRCKHYFCEHCALKHNAQSKNCFVCNTPTGGVFNTAHEIIRRGKEKKGKEGREEGSKRGELGGRGEGEEE